MCPKLNARKLGVNHSGKDELRRNGKKVKPKKKKKKKRVLVATQSKDISIYSGAIDDPDGLRMMGESVDGGDLVDELGLTRVLIVQALNSQDAKMKSQIPNLIKTAGEIYDRIRRAVDGMRVVVSFNDAKFSREVTEKLSGEVHEMLEGCSESLCPECKVAFKANLSKSMGEKMEVPGETKKKRK